MISASPETPHGIATRHLRALAYESGNVPGGISLEQALADFEFLAARSRHAGSVGLVGAARVRMKLDPRSNEEKVEELCSAALNVDNAPEASLLLGDLAVEMRGDEVIAREGYSRAYKAGSAAGLLRVASHMSVRVTAYGPRYSQLGMP